MSIHLKKWIKGTLIASLLLGVSLAQAELIKQEQMLGDTGFNGNASQAGGNSVAIDGEWAFVANTASPVCNVVAYRYNHVTNKWGDGGLDKKSGKITDTIVDGEAYVSLIKGGGS